MGAKFPTDALLVYFFFVTSKIFDDRRHKLWKYECPYPDHAGYQPTQGSFLLILSFETWYYQESSAGKKYNRPRNNKMSLNKMLNYKKGLTA